ncbi:hypothetical protein GCM10010313_77040 [Streptomyces violarus]|uniref:Uncharacterized protein n=1 Tax=Streptomyces violarus TaxID=67380 RepID=A0A7W4ZSH3_9ACTN|nr:MULTISPECIES: hypothetical protein [Streptomyces]MBB3077818.1 hypothetical protein [Streptomyces violarus]WRU00002.1 hypothetical protein VJ737_20890 [Streptomyces sp. CGMCC 4.1772]GHD32568.1 hypothetical protein GCM10010313_77040 [Streptomyces violarus]
MRLPDEQLRAGHIPADVYRQLPPGTDMRHVVIVQEAPRSYTGPIVLTLVITVGSVAVLLVIAYVSQIIAASVVSVLSASCGIGYTISRTSKRRRSSRALGK